MRVSVFIDQRKSETNGEPAGRVERDTQRKTRNLWPLFNFATNCYAGAAGLKFKTGSSGGLMRRAQPVNLRNYISRWRSMHANSLINNDRLVIVERMVTAFRSNDPNCPSRCIYLPTFFFLSLFFFFCFVSSHHRNQLVDV